MAKLSATKSGLLFDAIQASQGFYSHPVLNGVRSRVNVPIRISNGNSPSTELEAKFVKEAEQAKIFQVKGHRSVGGLRASLYNAVSVEDTKVFIEFMTKFMAENHLES
jgi:phosphoserine aminotransferase